MLETAQLTFVLLIAIRAYQVSDTAKAILLGSMATGLIASLFVMSLMRRSGLGVTRLAATIQWVGALGYLAAAAGSGSSLALVGGCSLAFFAQAIQIPLQTQWLRSNYGPRERGRRFAGANAVRAGVSVGFALAAGALLEGNLQQYPWLLTLFAILGGVSGAATWRIPEPEMASGGSEPPGVWRAMRSVGEDAMFRWVLLSAMLMGLGIHMTMALRVDYLVNPRFGLEFPELRVALLTSTLPALARLGTTFFWGMLFDRMNLIILRVLLNVIFGVAVLLFFLTGDVWVIGLGALLGGVARGGGEIVWNLWVTKLAPEDRVGEYMSVHTFLTGVRGLAAPFLGFYLAGNASLGWLLWVSLTLLCVSIAILIPLVPVWRRLATA